MKFSQLAAMAVSVLVSFSASADPKGGSDVGSAFVNNGILYVTLLGDCNQSFVRLEVEPLCLAGRMTANYAEVCEATVRVSKTRMACPESKPRVEVKEINLAQAKLTREAKTLLLNLAGKQIELSLD